MIENNINNLSQMTKDECSNLCKTLNEEIYNMLLILPIVQEVYKRYRTFYYEKVSKIKELSSV